MTLNFDFTDRNSVRIMCGDDTIEVGLRLDGRLEVVQLSIATKPVPSAVPTSTPTPSSPPGYLPRTPIRLKRPIYPRTSFVVVTGQIQDGDDDVFAREWQHDSMVGLSQLVKPSAEKIEAMVQQYARTIGRTRILDVHADSDSADATAGFANLERLVVDPEIRLDAVRLWIP